MSATTIAKQISGGIGVVGSIAGTAQSVLPWVNLVAGFFPGAASVISALQIAAPIIQKISEIAPVAVQAIEAGQPIFDAIEKAGPDLLPHIKALYATFANADPTRPETEMTADDVSDREALAFAGPVLFGREWTQEETQRWWDKATGDVSNS
jgi:hypothetical protein